MNEEVRENGLPEEQNDKQPFKASWAKTLSWLSIIFSLTAPVVGIGLAIVCISSCDLDEKEEVTIISGISLVIAVTLCIHSILLGGMY